MNNKISRWATEWTHFALKALIMLSVKITFDLENLVKNKYFLIGLALLIAAAALLYTSPANAQGMSYLTPASGPECTPEADIERRRTQEDITWSVLRRLTLRYDNDGNPVYAGSCRTDHFGCEERIRIIAEMIVYESNIQGVDPWIVASIIWKESRFYPFARGGVGERGVMQLHPRNSRFRQVQFVHSPWYRRRCRRRLGNCQEEIIEAGVTLLRANVDSCDGYLYRGLTQYNTGQCLFRNRYARRVFQQRRTLIELSRDDGC